MRLTATMIVLGASAMLSPPELVEAHPGGLNAEGCHNNRRTGGYHCHRGSSRPSRATPRASGRRAGAYVNCSAARAAGAAPVHRGEPGYGSHLDRDNDGVGCE